MLSQIESTAASPKRTNRYAPIILLVLLGALIGGSIAFLPVRLSRWLPLGVLGTGIGLWVFSRPFRALLVYVFLIPLEIYLSPALRITSNQVFQVVLLASWALYIVQSQLRNKAVSLGGWPLQRLLVTILVLFLLLSLVWSIDPDASMRSLFRHLAAIGVFWVTISIVRKPSQLEAMITAMCLGATVMVVYGLLQYWRRGYDALYPLFSPFYQDLWLARGWGFGIVATFANPSMLVGFGSMVLPLVLGRIGNCKPGQRMAWMLIAASLSLVILLTFSKAGWIMLVLVAVAWAELYLRRPSKLLAAIIGVVVVMVGLLNLGLLVQQLSYLFPNSYETSIIGRLTVWNAALSAFARQPIVGYGLDGFTAATASLRSALSVDLIRAHNIYLQTLVDLGLVGFVLYFGTVVSIFAGGLGVCSRSLSGTNPATLLSLLVSVGCFLVHGFFDALNGFNAYVSLQWVILGLLVAATVIRRRAIAGRLASTMRAALEDR